MIRNFALIILIALVMMLVGVNASPVCADEQNQIEPGATTDKLSTSGSVTPPVLRDLSAAVSALHVSMAPKGLEIQGDGVQMLADGMGLGPSELLNGAQNGLTADGEPCSAPLEKCHYWWKVDTMVGKLFAVYGASTADSPIPNCIDLGHFASKVYAAKAADSSLGDMLSAIHSAASRNILKAILLEGVATAVFADDNLDREKAFQSVYSVCNAQPRAGR